MSTASRLARLLADGRAHSGTDLAAELNVSRAAVWKAIERLRETGLRIDARAGKGYRLAAPFEPLDEDAIGAALDPAARERLQSVTVHWALDSTNDWLLEADPAPAGRGRACLAEYQHAGRGRQQRAWFAVPGHGLCLSLAWTFANSPGNLQCLSLAAGVGVLRALRAVGAGGAQLKWPNDVVIDGAKLAGILIDVRGEADGPLHVVCGIGLNFAPVAGLREAVVASGGLPPASLTGFAHASVSRNRLAAHLLAELAAIMAGFPAQDFAALAREWQAADYLFDKPVVVQRAGREVHGIARGIEVDGRLRLDTPSGAEHVLSGEVSVRAAD